MSKIMIYGLFHQSPDYGSSPASLVSLHYTFKGAVAASFAPDVDSWRKSEYKEVWYGPDGFGLIRKLKVS